MMRGCFNYADVAHGSALPFVVSISSASCPCDDISWPSSACVVADSASYAIATTSATFFCFAAFCVTSRVALTSAGAFYFNLFFAN